jgi:hypothetical protein
MTKANNNRAYECSDCININTPLCQICNCVNSPSGKVSKPTYYQDKNGGSNLNSQELVALAGKIILRVAAGAPINLTWVMRYNKLLIGGDNNGT